VLVVATIFPVADVTARIGGDAVRVETLLPPRASTHTWEATPGQIRSLGYASAYITVGGGLDGWLEGLGTDIPGLRTLRLTERMRLARAGDEAGHGDEHASTGDPHVWLDPLRVRDEIVPQIRDLLVALVPAEEAGIRARSDAFADSLTVLDQEIRAALRGRTRDGFIATHDAWSYFAERFGLVNLGNLYPSPGHEPSAQGLARLVEAARAEGLAAVLSEPQLSETAARALAAEIGGEVVLVDPLGGAGVEGRGSYLDLMRFNARAFARVLGVR
jgi:ABC-type Zn uptake system ZnuABC Zn-binding protein ZnuA